MGDMEEKDMVVGVEEERGGGGGAQEGSEPVKSAPNEELNSKVASGGHVGGHASDESVVAVAGSVDESVDARVSSGGEEVVVSGSGDPKAADADADAPMSGDVVDAAEKVESWDLSEAVAKSVDEKEDLMKPKVAEEESPVAPVVSIDSIEEDSVGVGAVPVSVSSSPHGEEKSADSEHADGGVTEASPSGAVGGGEDVRPEASAEGADEKGSGESGGVDVKPVEEVHEVVDATKSAEEPDEVAARSMEVVPSPLPSPSGDDVEAISGEVNSNDDVVEVPSESVGHEVVKEPATDVRTEADEGAAEPEPVSAAPAVDDGEEKSVAVGVGEDVGEAAPVLPSESDGNKDASPQGPPDIVASKALDAPGDSEEGLSPEEEVMKPPTSAKAIEEAAAQPESVSVSAPDVGVDEKSVEVGIGEDVGEAAPTVLSSESAELIDDVSREIHPAPGPSDNVDSEARDQAPVDSEGFEPEVVNPPTSVEADEGSVEPESVSAAADDDVEEKSVEVKAEDKSSEANAVLPSENSVDDEDVSRKHEPAEGSVDKVGSDVTFYAPAEEVHEVVESTIDADHREESSAEPESMSVPPQDKSVEVNSGDVPEASTELESADNEVAGSDLPVEGSADDNVSSEALESEAVEPTASAEPEGESAEPELVSASDHVEGKAIDVNSEGTSDAPSESANKEVVSSELPAESVDQIGETAGPSSETKPESEESSTETASVSAPPPSDLEDKSVVVTEAIAEPESADIEVDSSTLPGGESADALDAEVVQPTTSEEPVKELAEPESVPAPSPSDTVEDIKCIDGLNSDDVSKVSSAPETANNEEDVTPEPSEPEEEPLGSFGSEVTLYAPAEEVHEAVEATISEEESAEPESMLSPSHDVDDGFVMVDSRDVPEADKEVVSPDVPVEGSADDNVSSEALETEAVEPTTSAELEKESAKPELVSAPDHVDEDKSFGVNSEGKSEAVTVLPSESAGNEVISRDLPAEGSADKVDAPVEEIGEIEHAATDANPDEAMSNEEPSVESHEKTLSTDDGVALVDRCVQMEELPHGSGAENQRSVSMDGEVNAGDEGITDGGESVEKEENREAQSVSGEDVSHALKIEMSDEEAAHVATQPVEDLSHLLQTVMTDEEVKAAAAHHPEKSDAAEESVEDIAPPLESENSGAAQANEVETVSREFNFSEAPTENVVRESGDESHDAVASEQVTPYLATALATASGGKGNSSDAAASDTTELEISSPPVVENEVAPRSYNLDAVASKLHDAAEKALKDAQSSDIGEGGKASVARSVAQIVLDESSKTGDSSEYISGVVQDVAHLAQNAATSDPNILPDTVARVFDGESADSPSNETSESKGSTSLGNMVSLFIVWCVSLCASHISSKNMPAPALKLAAEEVTAVLHSNAPPQPAPSHHEPAAPSNH